MKKVSLLLLTMILSMPCVFAQQPKIEKSESFEIPTAGFSKVLLLKNGNTAFFHFTKKEGIEVKIYDKSRKMIANQTVTSELWNPKRLISSIVEGLYEINGEPVLFLAQFDGREPTLYRLRFDPFTGNIVKEEQIGSMPKIKAFDVASADKFYIEKDANSDCYVVIYFNAYGRGTEDRIKVVHYDGTHKAINVGYYELADESLRYLNYIGAVVDGNKRVFISTYAASNLKGENGHVFVSRLNSTDSTFFSKPLDFTEDFRDTKSVMHYNRTSNTIQMLALALTKSKGGGAYYLSFMSYIDPETMGLKSVKLLTGEKTNEYIHNVLQIEKNYQGMPQTMIVNKDNSTTVLSEEMTQQTTVNQYGAVVSASTLLGGIGVSELKEDGTEKSGYVLMKNQMAGGIINPLYMSSRRKGKWMSLLGYNDYNSYISYDYIGTDNNRYIIFNDNTKNFGKDEDDRRRALVNNPNKLNTVCYALKGNDVNKFYLFGATEEKDQSNTCYIDASDYMAATNTYATLLIERDGHDRQVRMAWITFQ